ncbi:hypothetical protein CGRA01v4_01117 [Colletotrichum graminicola]|nr:hypothetical protein CGRA01v4_01117 [Colletotrichum graminicola]
MRCDGPDEDGVQKGFDDAGCSNTWQIGLHTYFSSRLPRHAADNQPTKLYAQQSVRSGLLLVGGTGPFGPGTRREDAIASANGQPACGTDEGWR